jgi:rod shape-determining protein MreC
MEIERYEKSSELSIDETSLDSNYRVIAAKLINNSYSKSKNRLTIDKGSNNKIALDMGVITSDGIVGIIDNISRNYATVQSILNTNSQINAKLKKSNHFGSLVWDTSDPNVVQLIDVPMLAAVEIGDTVVTGGRSTIFPEGIPIGTVNQVELDKDGNFFDLDIVLFNDMTSLGHVYVIENLNSKEIKQVELEKDHVEE